MNIELLRLLSDTLDTVEKLQTLNWYPAPAGIEQQTNVLENLNAVYLKTLTELTRERDQHLS